MLPAGIDDEVWNALSEDEQTQLADHLTDLQGGESLVEFVARTSPHHPVPDHLMPVVDEIERARVEPVKVAVSLPPGHGKTSLFLNAFVWWMTKNPADTNAYYTYASQLAQSKSAIARELAGRERLAISPSTDSKSEWRLVQGGGLLAGGVSGGLTGYRTQGLLVLDDPYKNAKDASSQTYRDDIDDFVKGVAIPRMEGASIFVVHTRWHKDDQIGRISKRKGWRVINIPAIAEEGDLLGRPEGAHLWDLHPLPTLLERKEDLGEYLFAALYQGRPRPKGGTIFGEPHYYDPETVDLSGCQFVLACDPAASEKTSADYSAAVVLAVKARKPEPHEVELIRQGQFDQKRLLIAYVLRVYRKQVSIPVLVGDLIELQSEFGNTRINVESVGAFKAIPQMLRSIDSRLRVKEIQPQGDKFTRSQRCAAAWNAGRILLPAPTANPPRWLGAFLDELLAFTGTPGDRNDDQVDALVHAFNESRMGTNKTSMLDVV